MPNEAVMWTREPFVRCLPSGVSSIVKASLLTGSSLKTHTKVAAERLAAAAQVLAEGAGEGTAKRFAEGRCVDARGVDAEGGSHRREQRGAAAASAANEERFVGERIDAIQNVVVGVQVERVGRVGAVSLGANADVGLGVDAAQAFGQHFGLEAAHGGGEGGELPVDVRRCHAVEVDEREVLYAAANQSLCTPRPHAACAEERHANCAQALHAVFAQ